MTEELTPYKLTLDRLAAVSITHHWIDDMTICPRGTKVLLLGAGGVATIGNYDGNDDFFVAWAALPKRIKQNESSNDTRTNSQ